MATLRSYSATFDKAGLAQVAVTRWRFNEDAGTTTALDSVDALDGSYRAGAAPGAAGSIGDGAASFTGSTGFVLVETLSGTITVSAFGDSLIAGAGFPVAADRFAPNLEAALEARGLTASVVNQGVGGNTTAQGLLRVDDVIGDDPDVVIVEFGTNDATQDRLPLTLVENDLRDIITALRAEEIQVLVTGTFGFFPERHSGSGYDDAGDRDDFEAIFANLVTEFDDPGVVLLNDVAGSDKFLGGVRIPGATPALDTISGGVLAAGDPQNLNSDGLHPNAAGIDVIVPRMVPQTIALGAAAGVVNEPLLLANGAFEMWFTLDELGQPQTLLSKNSAGQGTGGQVAALVSADGGLTFALGSETTDFLVSTAAGTVPQGEPTHLVANFGAGGMHVFINGEEAEVTGNGIGYSGGLLGNFEQLVIGAATSSSAPGTIGTLSQFFDGTIDEFGIYNRALSAGEVQRLFDAGERGSTVVGTAEADTLIGGSDDENLRGAGGDDRIRGKGGDDALRGGGGADDLRSGPGDDALNGMGGHDLIIGGSGDDLLQGGGGRDTLSGSGGADELFGGGGVDALSGGAGDDLLNGGPGRDTLSGGTGSDTFQIDQISDGVDKIRRFEDGPGGDVLDLRAVLDFGGGDDFNDFVRLNEVNSSTRVEVDADGGGDAFTAVLHLIGVNGLDIGNLVNDGNVQLNAPTS